MSDNEKNMGLELSPWVQIPVLPSNVVTGLCQIISPFWASLFFSKMGLRFSGYWKAQMESCVCKQLSTEMIPGKALIQFGDPYDIIKAMENH